MPKVVEKMSDFVDLGASDLTPRQDVVLLRAGYRARLCDWRARNSLNPFWVLWYNTGAGCGCLSGDRIYELTGENLLLIPPYTRYSGMQKQVVSHYYIWFSAAAPFDLPRREVLDLPVGGFRKQLAAAFAPGNLRQRTILYGLVTELLLGIPENFFRRESVAGHVKVVDEAIAFINRRNGNVSNAEIAAEVHLSPIRFSHLFKEEMAISPQRYCRQIRMYQAMQLLRDGMDIKSAAEACGFADRYHFSKEFKKHHNSPPGKWQKTYRKQ